MYFKWIALHSIQTLPPGMHDHKWKELIDVVCSDVFVKSRFWQDMF